MKGKVFVFVAIALSSVMFTSCTKYYSCECTDYKGVKYTHVVDAKSRISASKNCRELGMQGSCELK